MLIIGLGNPGREYEDTRHNIGFQIVDSIASELSIAWKRSSKFNAEIASGIASGIKFYLVKPQTYMNLSGTSVSLIKSYYNISIEDIIVLHDELDINLGEIKYKQGGGSAGHNGIKSLDAHIGNNYHRLRIGISRPQYSGEVSSYVLSRFTNQERDVLQPLIEKISQNYLRLIKKDFKSIIS